MLFCFMFFPNGKLMRNKVNQDECMFQPILKEKTSNFYQYQVSTESLVQAMPRPQNPDLVNRNLLFSHWIEEADEIFY